MNLDMTQPWMHNHVIKARILNATKPMNNPTMQAYQEEFNKLALVPIETQGVSERAEYRHVSRSEM